MSEATNVVQNEPKTVHKVLKVLISFGRSFPYQQDIVLPVGAIQPRFQ